MNWVVNPAIDLLFCCGGLIWLLLSANACGLFAPYLPSFMIIVMATHAMSESHTAATWERIYGTQEDVLKFAARSTIVAALCVLVLFVGLTVNGGAAVLAKIYLMWVLQHFAAQAFGIAALYCRKNGCLLAGTLRRLLVWMLNLAAVAGIARNLSPGHIVFFLNQPLPQWDLLPNNVAHYLTFTAEALFVVFVFVTLFHAIARKNYFPLPALLMVATSMFMLCIASDGIGAYLPALFHATQYLVVAWSRHAGVRRPGSGFRIAGQPAVGLRYIGLLALGAVSIYVVAPLTLSVIGFNYYLSFASTFCVVNFHHFIVDAIVWKLRDAQVRSSLSLAALT